MKSDRPNPAKELYAQLRTRSCEQLWQEEIPRFDRATAAERNDLVGLVRAVGVVFSESGTAAQKEEARAWLRGLLQDSNEKVRRYAMTALPKLGANPADEKELLSLLAAPANERETKHVGRTLGKIGGAATLEALQQGGAAGVLRQTEQKVKASVARAEEPSGIRLAAILPGGPGWRLHLRCRAGLEQILRGEVAAQGRFTIESVTSGLVAVTAAGPFALADVYALRCFATVSFVLGEVSHARRGEEAPEDPAFIDALAARMTSDLARTIFSHCTEGSLRYRLEFVDKGHQRGSVRLLANRAYARCPEILNDPRSAPWTMALRSTPRGTLVELSPRLRPDPRFLYRLADVPAASHPPLAACMARLAGPMADEIVWDPFCGSGLELIERSRLGGVRQVFGTDTSAEAIAIAEANFAAAGLPGLPPTFTCCDFRDFRQIPGLAPGAVTLVVSNPPMGQRVPIPNLRGLIGEFIAAAATVLRPGGRLVFANPFRTDNPHPALALVSRRNFDLGGLECRLEMYRKK